MEQSINSILSHRGYSIRKSFLSSKALYNLKKDLTVTPISHPDYPLPQSFSTFEEGKNWIRIPRAFGINKFGEPDLDRLEDHFIEDKVCHFKGTLRPNQLKPHDTFLNKIKEVRCGILCMQTGSGKTVTLLSILSHLKQRTCILLHKSQLLQQWQTEIRTFLPEMSIGIIQQKRKQFDQRCDIYLVMIQTILNIEDVPNMFGLTVIDESHHIPSNTFSRVLFKVNSKYLVGLTATPDRKDGLTKVLNWHVGEILYREQPDRRNQRTTLVEIYHYNTKAKFDPKKYSEMITKLCFEKERNVYILCAIRDHLRDKEEAEQRQLLILTERKAHANLLHAYITKDFENVNKTCGLLLGGMKTTDLESEMEKDILIATYNLMSEGISISKLNSILFATPKRDVVQALGRIFRKIHTDVDPLIIDIADDILKGQQRARLTTYKKELNGNIKVTHHFEQ